MNKLTKKEEAAMKILWKAKKGFIKELLDVCPDPKPVYTTFSSVIVRLESKGYVFHKAYGKNYEYYPNVTKEDYMRLLMHEFVKAYFGSSYKKVILFFIVEKKVSIHDLKNLIELFEMRENGG